MLTLLKPLCGIQLVTMATFLHTPQPSFNESKEQMNHFCEIDPRVTVTPLSLGLIWGNNGVDGQLANVHAYETESDVCDQTRVTYCTKPFSPITSSGHLYRLLVWCS